MKHARGTGRFPILDGSPFASADEAKAFKECAGADPDALRRTNVIVFDETPRALAETLAANPGAVSRAKLYSSYAKIRNDLPDLRDAAKEHGTDLYVGGGVLERANQKEVLRVVEHMRSLGLGTAELSNSTGAWTRKQYATIAKAVRKEVDTLLVEVGRKDGKQDLNDWSYEIRMAEDVGADGVIIEGTGQGVGGVYTDRGHPKSLMASMLFRRHAGLRENAIVEAPQTGQQSYWLTCGALPWNARFGNVRLGDVMALTDRRISAMPKAFRTKRETAENHWDAVSQRLEDLRERHADAVDEVLERVGMACVCEDDKLRRLEEIIDGHVLGGGMRSAVFRLGGNGFRSIFSDAFGTGDEL